MAWGHAKVIPNGNLFMGQYSTLRSAAPVAHAALYLSNREHVRAGTLAVNCTSSISPATTLACTAPHSLPPLAQRSRYLPLPPPRPALPPPPTRIQARQLRRPLAPPRPSPPVPDPKLSSPTSPSLKAPAAPRPPARPHAATCSACPRAPPSTPRPPPPAGAWA